MQSQQITTIVKFGQSKLEFTLPSTWSVNKTKCLLVSQIPTLNFDEFELSLEEKLLRGNYKLRQVAEMSSEKDGIELAIVKTKSETKLNEYYKSSMGNFMSLASYNSQPILSLEFQKYSNILTSQKENPQNNNQNINDIIHEIDAEEAGNPGNPIHPLLRALRLVGFYLILVLIYDHGKIHQIAIIAIVILFYYALEFFIKHKQRKIKNNAGNGRPQPQVRTENRNQERKQDQNQNNPQEQRIIKDDSRLKGLFTLYYYKTIQIVFCFLLTFFPNLSIDMHLQINKEKIDRAREEVNHLIPNSYTPEVRAQPNR